MGKKLYTKEDLVNIIKETMTKRGYKQVGKKEYHKNKRKKRFEHGCWRIGNYYYYFLKELTK